MSQPGRGKYVGRNVRRLEDDRLLRGQGQFVDDIELPGMLHAHFLRSPVAHALIVNLDLTEARRMPGVRGVFTYEDLRKRHRTNRVPLALPAKGINFDVDPSVLADRELTYVGEPVVLVVAESRAEAEDAAAAVSLEYRPLPVVVDPRRAAMPDSAQARLDCPHNVMAETGVRFGDLNGAFNGAGLVISENFQLHKGGPHAIETRGVVARFDPAEDVLTIWETSQMPHRSKAILVKALGLGESQIRVLTRDVGGGFGAKGGFYAENLAIPTAAMILGRPVKWIEDRYESFLSCSLELKQEWQMEAAFDSDGRIRGIRGVLYHEAGANVPYGIHVPYNAATNLIGPYALPAYDLRILLVLTNKVGATATRGAGRPQGTFVMERLMDRAADRLGLARDEIRRRNFIAKEQMPYTFPVYNRDGSAMIYDSGDYPACQRRALELAGAAEFEARRAEARAQGRVIGLGIANYVEATGRGPYESGAVRVTPSGRIVVTSGATSQGQGTQTMLAQIAADAFDAPLEDIEVRWGDTAATPLGLGAYASRQAATAGSAIAIAARQVVDKARQAAAHLLAMSEDDLEFTAGHFRMRGLVTQDGDANYPSISLREVAQALGGVPGFALPGNMPPGLAASVDFQPDNLTYSNGCHVVEAEVDTATGHVRLTRYIVVHDCGRLIHPKMVDGQVLGGVVHGIGATLYEWMRYDEEGQPLAATYADYLLPTADVVPRIEIEHMVSPSPLNPLGVKGAGEAGTIAAPSAIIAAVEDALKGSGIFITDLPLTPNRLVALLDRKEDGAR